MAGYTAETIASTLSAPPPMAASTSRSREAL